MKGIYPCAKDNSDFALHTIHIALAHPCMSCRLLAHPGRHTHASGRLLSGEDRSRPPLVGAAVHDPERLFAARLWCNAQMATASSPPTPRHLSDPPKGDFLRLSPDELGRWRIERRHCQVQGNNSGVVRVDTPSSIPTALWRIAPNRAGRNVMENVVVVALATRGTHKGELTLASGTLAPTGKAIDVPSCDVFHLESGKIISFHCYNAASVMQQQLGVGLG
jgi:hypothetical protein